MPSANSIATATIVRLGDQRAPRDWLALSASPFGGDPEWSREPAQGVAAQDMEPDNRGAQTQPTERDRAIDRVAEAVHRANEAIQRAVALGISIELAHTSRHRDGSGAWGDQMVSLARAGGPSGGA